MSPFSNVLVALVFVVSLYRVHAQSWTMTSAPVTNWQAVACSADGSKIVAAVNGAPIYISTNSGGSWLASTAPATNWASVASSADGSKLFAGATAGRFLGGLIYCSTNSGASWAATTAEVQPWLSVACSADGEDVIAA